MTTTAGLILMDSIVPLIKKYVPLYLRPVGCEDVHEVIQDTLATAAAILDSAERRGVPINARSIVYYSIQSMRSGIRSTGRSKTDVLSPITIFKKRSSPESINETHYGPNGGECTLADLLVDSGDDPCVQASKHLDWDLFLHDASQQDEDLLLGTAAEVPVHIMAKALKMSSAGIVSRKRFLAKRLATAWKTDPRSVVADSIRAPLWQKHVRSNAEGRASRYERLVTMKDAAKEEGVRAATKKRTRRPTPNITITGDHDAELARAA